MDETPLPGRRFSDGRPDVRERVSAAPRYCTHCHESGYMILGPVIGRAPEGTVYAAWHLWRKDQGEELGCAHPKGLIVPDARAGSWVSYGEHCERVGTRPTPIVTSLIPVAPSVDERDLRFLPSLGHPRPEYRFRLGAPPELLPPDPPAPDPLPPVPDHAPLRRSA